MEKWLSRKLFVALVADVLAVVLVFGGKVTAEQAAAIITLSSTVYMVANAIASKKA